jgi:hypothetical protein
MFHGVYVKSRPRGKWYLASLTISAESASEDMNTIIKQAKLEDNISLEVKIQSFESGFYIPEILSEVKEQKLLYN